MGRSRWFHLLALPMLAALSHPALAGLSPPGVNLRWDRCYVDNGASNRDFACDSNSGQDQLVGSFELDQPASAIVTEEIVIDVHSASPVLPAWWNMFNARTCRPLSLDLLNFPTSDPSSCAQWIVYPSGGGIATYDIGEQGTDHVRVTAAVTSHLPVTLAAGREYFGFRFTLGHEKTVGAGACGGCSTPVCIFLSRVALYAFGSTGAATYLDHGANWQGSQYVTWQSGYPVDVQRACDPSVPDCTLHYTSFSCVPYGATEARHSTWGAVKSLYR